LVKIEAAAAALTVTVVESFASVVAIVAVDGDGNSSQNRFATKVSCNKEGGAMAARAMATRVVGKQ
jgi:hypothetical protein